MKIERGVLNFCVDPRLERQLKTAAKSDGHSVSSVIREACRDWLRRNVETPKPGAKDA